MRAVVRSAWMSICGVLSLSACASIAQQDVEAVLVEPSAESRAELEATVAAALNAPSVAMAADALTRESVLIIERTPARDASGQRLSGRDFGKPEHFRLVMRGSRCVLIHVSTAKRYELEKSRCVAR